MRGVEHGHPRRVGGRDRLESKLLVAALIGRHAHAPEPDAELRRIKPAHLSFSGGVFELSLEAVDEDRLSGVDPAACFDQREPLCAVDLGELAHDARARRPLELKRVAAHVGRIDVAFRRPRRHDLSAGLLGGSELGEVADATAADALMEALYDAADEDAATGGPDLVRGIFPVVATVTAQGYRRVADEELRKAAERLVAARSQGVG
jgi:hypothetical protein